MADDEIDERLSRRFSTGDDEAAETEDDAEAASKKESQDDMTSQSSQNAENAGSDMTSQNAGNRQNERTEVDSAESQDTASPDSSQTAQTAESAQTSQNAQNVKKEWNVRSIYLDDDLNDDLSTAFKRLDFELSEAGADIDLRKTRHFYPLIVELGLEQLAAMDAEEVATRLQDTED